MFSSDLRSVPACCSVWTQTGSGFERPLHCLIQWKRRANTLFLEGYYEQLLIFHFLCRDCKYWAPHHNTSLHCPSATLWDHLMLRCNSCTVLLAIFHLLFTFPITWCAAVWNLDIRSWKQTVGWPVSSHVGGDVCFASCVLQAACRSNIGA